VSPIEIEHVVAEHPDVADAAVIGVKHDLKGEVAAAFIVPKPGCSPAQGDLQRFCREHLPAYMVPVSFTMVEALPRNEAGKLMRARVLPREDSR
jgi:acyl-coenzyme A synthetase/AMP-(fatty) acid ligase